MQVEVGVGVPKSQSLKRTIEQAINQRKQRDETKTLLSEAAEFFGIERDKFGEPNWEELSYALVSLFRKKLQRLIPKKPGRPQTLKESAARRARFELVAIVDKMEESEHRSILKHCQFLVRKETRLPVLYRSSRPAPSTLKEYYILAQKEQKAGIQEYSRIQSDAKRGDGLGIFSDRVTGSRIITAQNSVIPKKRKK
jgi:hypothetical protein